MQYRHYAQISTNGICVGELTTSSSIDTTAFPHMIEVPDEGYTGKKYNNGVWEDVPVDPNAQRVALEAQLAAIQAQLANLT